MKQRPIIANVMLARGQGGIEQAAIDYAEALKLARFEVWTIIHPKAAIRSKLDEAKLPYKTLVNFGAWDILAIFLLNIMLKKLKVTVSIAHGNRALSLLRHADAPRLIACAHNYKIKLAGAKAVFCPTRSLMRYADSFDIPRSKVYHIANMVRLPRSFRDREMSKPPLIGAMGRFVPKKGFEVFLESLAILQFRNISFRAVLGGTGEEEDNLKTRSHNLQINDVLAFLGWVENKEAFYNSLDVFCVPSHHEPFGIVVLEAMAHGLPVISTASEGPSEIISNDNNGILVEKNNATQMAESINQLIEDPLKYTRLSVNAYDTIHEYYDISVISKNIENAINNIITRG